MVTKLGLIEANQQQKKKSTIEVLEKGEKDVQS